MDIRKLTLVLMGIVGCAIVATVGLRPRQHVAPEAAALSGWMAAQKHERETLPLPRPQELGIVLPPGASPPAPDPPVFQNSQGTSGPALKPPLRQTQVLRPGDASPEEIPESRITPTPEELKQLEQRGSVAY